jgi:hypothetical protein
VINCKPNKRQKVEDVAPREAELTVELITVVTRQTKIFNASPNTAIAPFRRTLLGFPRLKMFQSNALLSHTRAITIPFIHPTRWKASRLHDLPDAFDVFPTKP